MQYFFVSFTFAAAEDADVERVIAPEPKNQTAKSLCWRCDEKCSVCGYAVITGTGVGSMPRTEYWRRSGKVLTGICLN